MMTWHLKDRTLEKAFEAYSGGKFVDALNYEVKHSNIDSEFIVYVGFVRECLGDDSSEICLCFKTDELEDIPEYNPHAWNNYPEVTPPEGVRMRVEARTLDDYGERLIVKFYGATYVDGAWRSSVESEYAETLRIFRFRPWEE